MPEEYTKKPTLFQQGLAALRDYGNNVRNNVQEAKAKKSMHRHVNFGAQVNFRAMRSLMRIGAGLSIAGAGLMMAGVEGRIQTEDSRYHPEEDIKLVPMFTSFALLMLATGVSGRLFFNQSYKGSPTSEAIDLIINLRKKFPSIPVETDIEKLQRLADIVPFVLSNVSEKDIAYLNSLIKQENMDKMDDEEWIADVVNAITGTLKGLSKEDLDKIKQAYMGTITLDVANKRYGNLSQGR